MLSPHHQEEVKIPGGRWRKKLGCTFAHGDTPGYPGGVGGHGPPSCHREEYPGEAQRLEGEVSLAEYVWGRLALEFPPSVGDPGRTS